ncbi:MAG: isoprenylcysteine carboxylmethyltransferase family protein [Anaerolineae bacterium]|nr:isoprenylcysteine carboxylmethyltransferase family protein [Anaerolineae bacterium]
MSAYTSDDQSTKEAQAGSNLQLKILARFIISLVVLSAVLFGLAGRLDWVMGWVTIVAYGVVYVIVILAVPVGRELAEERTMPKADTPWWDKLIATLGSLVTPLGYLVVAGLDQRNGWTVADIPLWLQVAGVVALVLGLLFASWAVAENRFYARYVRIQKERGHTAVTSGPYRFIRHPGYVGTMVMSLGIPLALGSLWALALGALFGVAMVIRTALEDRYLQANLPGYKDYAQLVRYRLLPGIW